ncbi:GNAT family N-acetyltransferase [Siminovitchia fortis]|uniref:GNAT family N-acetyltransferase n=1 Tax=Siminovitchia fortis TaxID=254758 RepID=A0A443IK67_9BACI|nr:GNAT family N-acetyltransferase [Siminovitchia fortis]RWR05134.1 GNAT family N-acetyltransferase [Siminovitchia fortis]WHY81795.1 GNAT family N-acetyltransferase [Siminovitchia fortis]
MSKTYIFKPVMEHGELQKAVDLQVDTWGREIVTALAQLVAAIHNGGCVIGAYDSDRMIGFVYGFPGITDISKKPHLVSHMMAVDSDYRNQGIGESLKRRQREWAIEKGYEKITWTFDPLEIKNGYLNLSKLGGYVRTYYVSYYGITQDKINKGMPTDRFLLEWDLLSEPVVNAGMKKEKYGNISDYPLALDFSIQDSLPVSGDVVRRDGEKVLLVPAPKDIQALKNRSFELAYDWRMKIRQAIQALFSDGYVLVAAIPSDDVGYYILEKETRNTKRSGK